MGGYRKGSQHTVVKNKGKRIKRLRTIYTHTFHLCLKFGKAFRFTFWGIKSIRVGFPMSSLYMSPEIELFKETLREQALQSSQ